MAEALFSPEIRNNNQSTCLICNETLSRRAKTTTLGQRGWATFQEQAEKWSDVAIPYSYERHHYTKVYGKVKNIEKPFGKVHNSCRGNFASESYLTTLINFHGKISEQPNFVETDDQLCNSADSTSIPNSPIKERLRSSIVSDNNHCFICNEETDVDHLEVVLESVLLMQPENVWKGA